MFSKPVHPLIYGVVLAAGTVFLFAGGPEYFSSRSVNYLWDLGHIVYFSLLAVLLSRWDVVATRSPIWQWTIILVATLLAGISIELMQSGVSRTPDAWDVFRDLTGSVLVLVFGPPGSSLKRAGRRLLLRVAVLFLLSLQLWPLTKSLIDETVSRRQFPVLSDFETPFELDRWQGNATASVETMPAISPGRILKLSLTTDRYSGLSLKYFDGRWAPFRTLRASLYNPGLQPLQITIRVHDLRHVGGGKGRADRFNRDFLLAKGWNPVEIDLHEVEASPAGRQMDMDNIRGVGFYVVSQPVPRILYLDNVLLTR